MFRYFTYLQSANMPKNKLQSEALKMLKDKSSLLITGRIDFIDDLRLGIDDLNKKHPRCQALKVSTTNSGESGENTLIWLGEAFTVSFHIYRVKEAANES